jgi:hypothetical protein
MMTIEKIVDYVLHTPHNTNKAILISMLRELQGNADPDGPGGPDVPGDKNVIYDGGMEV